MSITSMLFVFLFLPLALAIYYLAVKPVKEYVLLIISLVFYSLGSIDYIFLFAISIVVTVLIGRTMAKVESNKIKRVLLVLGIVFNIALLSYFKCFEILLPLGVSFYTFKAISYLADVYSNSNPL